MKLELELELGSGSHGPVKDASRVKRPGPLIGSNYVCIALPHSVSLFPSRVCCVIYVPHNANLKNNFRNYPQKKIERARERGRDEVDLVQLRLRIDLCACALKEDATRWGSKMGRWD